MLTSALLSLLLPTIWIVDANNAPGTNFTDLPPAVAAAQSGDTILVRAGTYSGFYVSGKALTIRGTSRTATIIARNWPGASAALPFDTVTIDNTPPGTAVFLGSLAIAPPQPTAASFSQSPPALLVLPAGTVTVSDCAIIGVPQSSSLNQTAPGSEVQGTLHAVRTTFDAAAAQLLAGFACVGGPGVAVSGSGIFAAHGCTCRGGNASSSSGTPFTANCTTGAGLAVSGGRATLTQTSCNSGSGYIGGVRIAGSITIGAGVDANGGAVRLASGSSCATGTASGLLSNVQVVPGIGLRVQAAATAITHAPVTINGTPPTSGIVTPGPTLPTLSIAGTAFPSGELDASQPAVLTIQAPAANAGYVLLANLVPDFVDVTFAPVVGEVLVPLTGGYEEFGVLNGQGQHVLTFTPVAAIPSLLGVPLYFQAAMLELAQARVTSREVLLFR